MLNSVISVSFMSRFSRCPWFGTSKKWQPLFTEYDLFSKKIGISGKKRCLYLVILNLDKVFVTFCWKFIIKDYILAKYMFTFLLHRGFFIKQLDFPIISICCSQICHQFLYLIYWLGWYGIVKFGQLKLNFVSGKRRKKSKEKQKRQLWNIEVKVKSEISNLLP